MKFNERLLELRKKKGWSQEELGYKLDVSRQTVSKWESGQTTPELEKLRNLAKIFEISVDELISEEDIIKEEINTEKEEPKSSDKKCSKVFKYIKMILSLVIISILIIYVIIVWRRIVIIRNVEKILMDWLGKHCYIDIRKYEYDGTNEIFPVYGTEKIFYLYNDGELSVNKMCITEDFTDNPQETIYYESYDGTTQKYSIKVDENNKTYSNVEFIPFEHRDGVYSSRIYEEYQKKFGISIGKFDLNTLLMAMNLKIKILKVENLAMDGYCISDRGRIYDSFSELRVDELTKSIWFEKRIYDDESKNLNIDERYYYKYNPKYVNFEIVQIPDLSGYTLVEYVEE